MSKLIDRCFGRLYRDEEGASFTEYGMLLIALVVIVGGSALILQGQIETFLTGVGTALGLFNPAGT